MLNKRKYWLMVCCVMIVLSLSVNVLAEDLTVRFATSDSASSYVVDDVVTVDVYLTPDYTQIGGTIVVFDLDGTVVSQVDAASGQNGNLFNAIDTTILSTTSSAGFYYATTSFTSVTSGQEYLLGSIDLDMLSEGTVVVSLDVASSSSVYNFVPVVYSNFDILSSGDLTLTVTGADETQASCLLASGDGSDLDSDGLIGCDDANCVGWPGTEGVICGLEEVCTDSYNNDATDTAADCDDTTCSLNEVCLDTDLDGVLDNGDNCPTVSNGNQDDTDGDGFGDVCDDEDQESCAESKDGDGDGELGCADSDCNGFTFEDYICEKPENLLCGDEHDNDWDGFYDGDDPDCTVVDYSEYDGNVEKCEDLVAGVYDYDLDLCYDPAGDEDGDGLDNDEDNCLTSGDTNLVYPSLSAGDKTGCYYSDLNSDGLVDGTDVAVLPPAFSYYGSAMNTDNALDINEDGKFTFADLVLFMQYYSS